MPRRSPRLLAKAAASLPVVKPVEAPAPVDPIVQERARIAALLEGCACKHCAGKTRYAHEHSCKWCAVHPEWRLISHNMLIMMEACEKAKGKDAKRAAALAIMSYINDSVIDFAKEHEKFKLTVLDRCDHFIAESGDNVLLRLVTSEVMRKLQGKT